MERFFASGQAVDVVLAVLVLEAALLILRGGATREVTAMLLPAALILLALRAALTGMAWPWIAVPLALSFPVHLFDMATRFRPRRHIERS